MKRKTKLWRSNKQMFHRKNSEVSEIWWLEFGVNYYFMT